MFYFGNRNLFRIRHLYPLTSFQSAVGLLVTVCFTKTNHYLCWVSWYNLQRSRLYKNNWPTEDIGTCSVMYLFSVAYGDWCSHIEGFWSWKSDNLLVVSYEEMMEVGDDYQSVTLWEQETGSQCAIQQILLLNNYANIIIFLNNLHICTKRNASFIILNMCQMWKTTYRWRVLAYDLPPHL